MNDLSKEIEAYALRNALEFGKAEAARILPKLFQHGLDKKNIKAVMPQIQKAVKEINLLSREEKEKRFESLKGFVKEHEEKERVLPELPEADNARVFRLAPYPSGALHIGNAKTYLLNALYAEKYNAKLLLIMDDTIGSEEKQIAPEAYQLIEEGFHWLDVHYEQPVIYKSDRLLLYYDYAEKLIVKNAAYVCQCSAEVLRKNREQGKECACRSRSVKEHRAAWKAMHKAEQGTMTLRIKTSMQDPNPAFRDRVLFKISDRKHPRVGTKYRVWPALEMSWAIDDHELGVTHILRGNDLVIETDMEKFIWDIFGWKHVVTLHTGLVNIEGIEGAKLSKSKAQQEVLSGAFTGWDDPRAWSMQSLRRRGIRPESVRQFVQDIGLNKHDITIPVDALYALNRKLIDAAAKRYYFVERPVSITIKNAPKLESVEIPVHPDTPEKKRTIALTSSDMAISAKDAASFKNSEVRLLHLYNIHLPMKGSAATFTSSENKAIPKIQWVSEGVKARILMDNGQWTEGLAERSIDQLGIGSIVQFERFGFVRLDKKPAKNSEAYEFWFAHA